MGNFYISTPILDIRSAPSGDSSPMSPVPFCTMYLDDPWTLPSLSTLYEDAIPTRTRMSLSISKVAYQVALEPAIDPGPSSSWKEEEDIFALPAWEVSSSHSHDFPDDVFTSNKSILKAMNGSE